jgi:hypothetical protein
MGHAKIEERESWAMVDLAQTTREMFNSFEIL